MTREQALEALYKVTCRLSANALISDRDADRELNKALIAVADASPDTTAQAVIEAARKVLRAFDAGGTMTPQIGRLGDCLAAHDRAQGERG